MSTSPTLLPIAGLPGTGKTTFARALARRLGAAHLNTDILRSAMGLRGRYDEATKALVYEAMEQRTAQLLAEGQTVVVDGTFYVQRLRESYRAIAAERGCPIHWLVVEAPEEVVRQRLQRKRAYSEADFEVYRKIKAQWEPFGADAIIIATAPVARMVDTAIHKLPL